MQLIEWLQRHGVLDFINATTTVVLAAFAFVELRRARHAERAVIRAGYGLLSMTAHRVYTVAEGWRQESILLEIRHGVFKPDAIVPDDWATVAPVIAQLRPQVATMASHAHHCAK